MPFAVDQRVKEVEPSDPAFNVVGYWAGGKVPKMKYHLGLYGFSNPISATVFAYLWDHPEVTAEAAERAVIGIEQLLDKTGSLVKAHGLTLQSAVSLIIPGGKLLDIGTKIVSGLGTENMKARIKYNGMEQASKNPHVPRANRSWTGFFTDEYCEYAVLFWSKYPDQGPAYKIGGA